MNLEDLYRLLRSSHVQAQGIVDTIDEPLVVLDDHGCVLDANRAFFGSFLVERDSTLGVPLKRLGNGQWDIPELTTLISEIIPKAKVVVDYEVTHDFPLIGKRTFLLTARRLWKPDNNSTNVLLVFRDVSERRERERESLLLVSETRHRLANLLVIVRALVNQTETRGRTAEEYKSALLGRLEAVSTAQSLMAGGGPSVRLDELVSAVVGGLGGSRFHVTEGPLAFVDEKQIMPLVMILHELATNALKYGAFSSADGRVDVSWRIAARGTGRDLHLAWTENGVVTAPPASGTGMGAKIVRASARVGLGGSFSSKFREGGLDVELTMPLQDNPDPDGG